MKRISWEQFNAATEICCKVAHKERQGRSLSRAEIQALMEATEGDGVQAVRDRAILALLYGAGLRRAEAAVLKLADYDPEKLDAFRCAVAKVEKTGLFSWQVIAEML